jgi:hypothetical protein
MYQLDATTVIYYHKYLYIFGHLYAHLQEYKLCATAYGVQHCKRELGVSGWFRSVCFVVLVPETCRVIYDNKTQFLHQICTSHDKQVKVKVEESRNMPGVAQRVAGVLGSQIP